MSRTYRKYIRQGNCTGSNTEFYRDMNRKCRRKNNHELRNLIANNDVEIVNDLVMNHTPIHDSWREPTDGTCLITKADKNFYCDDPDGYWGNRGNADGAEFWNRKFGKYFKAKNRKHYRIV